MRRKIAKRLRRQCLREGLEILKEGFCKEPGWRRKDCGYAAVFKYRGWEIRACAFDMLEVYRWMLDDILHWSEGDWPCEPMQSKTKEENDRRQDDGELE